MGFKGCLWVQNNLPEKIVGAAAPTLLHNNLTPVFDEKQAKLTYSFLVFLMHQLKDF